MTEPSPYFKPHFAGHNKRIRKRYKMPTYHEIISPCTLDEMRYDAAHEAWLKSVAAGDGMRGASVYRKFMEG